jgi:hypothetical protein
MSALLPESLHALGWPAANASAGALAVLNTSLASPKPAPATPAPAHFPFRELAGALILAAVLAAVALEARDWILRKRAIALEQAFEQRLT